MNILKKNDITIIKPTTRRLDATTGTEYAEKLHNLLKTGINSILIDLSDILYIDTRGFGFIIDAMKFLDGNGEISICCPDPDSRVSDFLRLTKMDRIFKIFPDPASAFAAKAA